MLTQGIVGLEHLNAKPVFPTVPGDISLKDTKECLKLMLWKTTNWSIKQQSLFTYREF
jgi:hypothetical protein